MKASTRKLRENKTGKPPLRLFKGTFNYPHMVYIEHSHAPNERAAFLRMCNQIAKKQVVRGSQVFNFFEKHPSLYTIVEDKNGKKGRSDIREG
jgi:hypothetical protein